MPKRILVDGTYYELPHDGGLGRNTQSTAWIEAISTAVNDLGAPPYTVVPAGATVTEIQALIDGLNGNGGLAFPAGTFSLGTTGLDINGNIRIQGAGQGATILTYTGSGGAIRVNTGTGVETLRTVFSDFTLDGTNVTTGGAYGFVLGQGSVSPKTGAGTFMNVTVKRFKTAGVKADFTALTTWFRCSFESNRDGWWSTNTNSQGCTTQTFIACRFANNTKRGAFIEQADSLVWMGNTQFEDNGEEGCRVSFNGAPTIMRNLTWTDSYFEDNGTAGAFTDLYFDTSGTAESITDVVVYRCRFQGNNPDGHMSLAKGTYTEDSNHFSPVLSNSCIAQNTSVCYVRSAGYRDPTTYWSVGANAKVTHVRSGSSDAVFQVHVANSGTLVSRLKIPQGARPSVTGARSDGTALADLLTDLDAMDIVDDGSSA